MKSDATKALKQIQRVIHSLEERKLEIVQEEFAAPLMEIVSIARGRTNGLLGLIPRLLWCLPDVNPDPVYMAGFLFGESS